MVSNFGTIRMDSVDEAVVLSPDGRQKNCSATPKTTVLSQVAGMFNLGCVKRKNKAEDGYIEFGQNCEIDISPGRTLGTFAGVFSPVALSMFSALLFLRVGFIVGNSGLLVTLFQFVIAYSILLFTVASICAISTNGAVEGGGAYFMISRTLGPDFGGSIGTLFFLANVVSSALYIVGCSEGLLENFGPSGYLAWKGHELPDSHWWRFLYCTVLNCLNLVVCLIGASMFAKTSVAILAIVCISLTSVVVSFFSVGPMKVGIPEGNTLVQNSTYHVNGSYTGVQLSTLQSNLYTNYSQDYTSNGQVTGFAVVFGVLFSGVTGIMAGANMSGELKEPGKSIPRGTISAVIFTFFCYVLVAILTAASCSHFLLVNNFIYMMPINIFPAFITIGVLTATFSASLSNLIGSSRVLEALAKDNIYGPLLSFITKGTWRGNPLAAVFTSWAMVQVILFIGSLNMIAQINSVLFLLSYLATNLACLGLDLTSAPNFRPSFKYYTWHTALIGLIGTLVMMYVINPLYATSSIVLCLLLVLLLHLFSPSSQTADWGSISQALIFHQVRKYLLMLDSRKEHVKFWRPQILLLVGNPRSCCPLIDFVNDMKKSGLYVLGHVIVGKEFSNMEDDPTLKQHSHWLSLVDHLKVKAFVELTVARSLREGLHHLSHISGMGAMKPNTIVLGFRDDEPPTDFFLRNESQYVTHSFDAAESSVVFPLRSAESNRQVDPDEYVLLIKDILRMHKNVCLCRHFADFDKISITKSRNYKYIDVWPVNFFNPSPEDPFDTISLFMLQLACIINMVHGWKHLELRVHLCEAQSSMDSDMTEFNSRRSVNTKFKHLLDTLRIKASINQVEEWTRLRASLRGSAVLYDTPSELTQNYLSNVQQLILSKSRETAVTFIFLAAPPEDNNLHARYLSCISELTKDLRPTVLVHGIRAVTSTTL